MVERVLNSTPFKGKTYLQKWVQQRVRHGLALSELGDWLYQARVELSESQKLRKGVALFKSPPTKHTNPSSCLSSKREFASTTRPSTPQRKELGNLKASCGCCSPNPQLPRTWPCVEWDSGCGIASQHFKANNMAKPKLNSKQSTVENEYYISDELFSAMLEKIQENLHQNIVHASRQLQAWQGLQEGLDYHEDIQQNSHLPQTPRTSSLPFETIHLMQDEDDNNECQKKQEMCMDNMVLRSIDVNNDSNRCHSSIDESCDIEDKFMRSGPTSKKQFYWSPENVMINHSRMISVATPRNHWIKESCNTKTFGGE